MSDQWFVLRNSQRHGPFSFEQLKQLSGGGKLRPTDLVSKDGMEQPAPAGRVPGLFRVAQAVRLTEPVVQPVVAPTKRTSFEELRTKLTQLFWGSKTRRIVTCVCGFLAIGIFAPDRKEHEQSAANPAAAAKPTSSSPKLEPGGVIVSVVDLMDTYGSNEPGGDKKYKKQLLIVSGLVREVGNEKGVFGQSTFVELYGRDKYDSPRVKCFLAGGQTDQAADLKPGVRTTIQGRCEGLQLRRIVLKDCRFIEKLNLTVNEFIQKARGKSFDYSQFVGIFGLPTSESSPAPISDDLFLYYDLKDGSVMVSVWKASWYGRGNLLINNVERVP